MASLRSAWALADAVRAQCFHLNVDVPTLFFALDASGKSAAHCHHRGYRKARTGKSAAGFFIAKQCYPQKSFKLSNLFHRIFRSLLTVQRTFDTSGKSPAHYHHREIM
jgi:hypothetical protein